MSPKTTAAKSVTYNGGLDAVVIHLPSGAIEFVRGVAVEVPADDAKSLADHPDFTPAPKATPTTTEPPKEAS